jgi:hypothetical protein
MKLEEAKAGIGRKVIVRYGNDVISAATRAKDLEFIWGNENE